MKVNIGLRLREKVIWGLVIMALPLVWFLIVFPKKEEASRIKGELSSLAKRANEAKMLLAQAEMLKQEAALAKEKVAFLEARVLVKKDVSRVLRELSQDLQRHNLRILSMKPLGENPPPPTTPYHRLPVEIQVQGRYIDLGKYLEEIKERSLLFTVDSLHLEKGEDPNLSARLVLVAYMWRK